MANSTFSGPVRSQNGFQIVSVNPANGAETVGATLTKLLVGSASLDFPSIAAVSQANLTITVNGAAVNDDVILGLPAAPTVGLTFDAFVSAANTVTVRATNVTAGAIDPAAATYSVLVIGTV
jgi:hypothetical protein